MVKHAFTVLALGAIGALGVVTLAGRSTSSAEAEPGTKAQAQALWADRTAYTGDNSKVSALVDDAGFGPQGTYSLSLWTTRPPYAVTISMHEPAKPFDQTDFSGPATLLLGTVGNLETVHVTSQGKTWTLTAREATAILGHDVKTLGTDRAALEDYLSDQRD